MAEYFSLYPDCGLTIRSFSSKTLSGKAVVRIDLETTDFRAMAYALQSLLEVQNAQKPRPSPSRPRRLALPAPEVGE